MICSLILIFIRILFAPLNVVFQSQVGMGMYRVENSGWESIGGVCMSDGAC